MRTILGLVAIGVGFMVMTAGSVAQAQVSIRDFKTIGSGCPKGLTATINTGDALIIGFNDNFVVSIGQGNNNKALDRKACTISLLLDTPVGYAYTLTAFHTLGTAAVAPRSMGRHQTKYWFQGTPMTAYSTTLVGSGDWWIDDSFDNPVYSSCHLADGDQKYLDITTSLSLSAEAGWDPTTTSTITEDFAFGTVYDLGFAPCP
jgi:hypothetical protein